MIEEHVYNENIRIAAEKLREAADTIDPPEASLTDKLIAFHADLITGGIPENVAATLTSQLLAGYLNDQIELA
ncbi:hypothetical protein D6T64_11780 [Cryobacterium melibiosiphilum]|uniref:Uncharacterized protein n=1 Tax=Cryobacterium melibiosiphilum TaxID=995039 RepID=A0A3A5MF57_9MICO|nr:hypothetical protein [Cryobacterium melibiosiphilum]RJT88062.1 hypothetical protein D6T64_11780 [Cryobacterium melibiosiphilum]